MRRPLCYVCLAFLISVFLFLYVRPPETTAQVEDGGQYIFTGLVAQKEYKKEQLILTLKSVSFYQDDSYERNKTNLFKNSKIKSNSQVLCYVDKGQEPKLGSYLVVKGEKRFFRVATNPGEFNQAFYQKILKNEYGVYHGEIQYESASYNKRKELLYAIRRRLEGILDQYMIGEDAAVIKAMLLGNRHSLSEEQKDLFQASGIAHILAISGVHISFLGMGLYRLLQKSRLPKGMITMLVVGLMFLYGEMVGMSSSAMRAIMMFSLQVLARQWKRTYDSRTALALSAVSILVEQPLYLFHAGYLLSFGSLLGISCLGNVFSSATQEYTVWHQRWKGKLWNSLSIFLVQFPIIVHFYYTFPLPALLLNLVIIPMISIVILCASICISVQFIPVLGYFGGKLSGICCHIVLTVCERACDLSRTLPYHTLVVGERPWWKYLIFYSIPVFLFLQDKKVVEQGAKEKLSSQLKLIMVIVGVTSFFSTSIGGMRITYLDVGQGDCICIENENRDTYLIDGGSSSRTQVGKYVILPFLKYRGVQRITGIFLTHMDLDHVSGIMEVLEQDEIPVETVFIPVVFEQNEQFEKLYAICQQKNIKMIMLDAGTNVEDRRMKIEVLYPTKEIVLEDGNAGSFVLKLEYLKFHALFTGDVDQAGELAAAAKLAHWKCDVFKVTHHGSKYSNTDTLIQSIRPKIAIISCGKKNRYGHPHDETLERLKQAKVSIFRTDETGAVMVYVRQKDWHIITGK